MVQRSQKSAESRSILALVDVRQQKPDAPKHLSTEQQQVWTDIVDAMKSEHFPGAVQPLLEIYCAVVVRLRHLEQQVRDVDPAVDFKKYRTLLRLQCQQTSLLCSLSTRLRILRPNRSTRDYHEPPGPRPWEL
jgi:hypothetical protein